MIVSESLLLSALVGHQCRRIRTDAGITQNKLAMHARNAGLRWTASKVGDFENGRTAPLFATVLAVSIALTWATGANVALADLVQSDDDLVALNAGLKVRGDKLADALQGQPWDLKTRDTGHKLNLGELTKGLAEFTADLNRQPWLDDLTVGDISAIGDRSGLDEERLAKRLGVNPFTLAAASLKLWGRTASEERDHRAGLGANAQKRGRVARELSTELKGLIHGSN